MCLFTPVLVVSMTKPKTQIKSLTNQKTNRAHMVESAHNQIQNLQQCWTRTKSMSKAGLPKGLSRSRITPKSKPQTQPRLMQRQTNPKPRLKIGIGSFVMPRVHSDFSKRPFAECLCWSHLWVLSQQGPRKTRRAEAWPFTVLTIILS